MDPHVKCEYLPFGNRESQVGLLKVLHIIDTLQFGGTEWQCLSLVRNLDSARFRNFLVYFKGEGLLLKALHGTAVSTEMIPFPGFRQLGAMRILVRLATFMQRHHIQIVQAYGFYSNVPAMVAGRMAGIPILVASRRDMGEFLSPWNRLVERGTFCMAHRVVVNAEAIKTEILTAGQVREGKIVVIPTGVDLDRFDQFMPSDDRPVWARKGKIVAMVAKFRKQKDQATLLRAAKLVLTVDPTVVFLLVGDGYLKGIAHQLARELGIASFVRFVGAIDPDGMPALLQHVDISVLASKGNEGIPNVVIESMAAGKPVVATDTGGCREAVRDGVTGFLVSPGDHEQLAQKILRLLQDEREAARMGNAGREKVEAEFSLNRMIEQFSLLYSGLARQKLGIAVEVG